MTRPHELETDAELERSPGAGANVRAMLQAAAEGDLVTVRRLVEQRPELAKGSFSSRTPLPFAVREKRLDLLDSALPVAVRQQV